MLVHIAYFSKVELNSYLILLIKEIINKLLCGLQQTF